ncbi:MAG: FAD-binding protein [Patescibacteria group bacterium]|nr:FAD-binding protein [Patescibacteria group bacterium]
MKTEIKTTDTVIIGAGFAGLYLSLILSSYKYKDFLLIAPDKKTVSDKSYYNFRSRGIRQESLKSSMIKAGKKKCNHQLVNVMSKNIDNELTYLSLVTRLRASYLGVQVVKPKAFLKKLRKKSEQKRMYDEIVKIRKNKNIITIKTTKETINCKKLIFCCGGNRSNFSKSFNDEKTSFNMFKIAQKIGCRVKSTNKIMYHPFYSKGLCIPSDDLFGSNIINKKGDRLKKTYHLIEAHNAHHCFEEIAKEFKGKQCYAVKNNVKTPLNVEPHYTLGGIKINKNGQTNIKNVYALGECSFGMHGHGRIGGCSLSEIVVMARIIAKKICSLE